MRGRRSAIIFSDINRPVYLFLQSFFLISLILIHGLIANSREFFSDLKFGKCSSVVEAGCCGSGRPETSNTVAISWK